jgi:hypothetical protein
MLTGVSALDIEGVTSFIPSLLLIVLAADLREHAPLSQYDGSYRVELTYGL